MTTLLDTGPNIIIIDRGWKDIALNGQEICPLRELMEEHLNVTAITGDERDRDDYKSLWVMNSSQQQGHSITGPVDV